MWFDRFVIRNLGHYSRRDFATVPSARCHSGCCLSIVTRSHSKDWGVLPSLAPIVLIKGKLRTFPFRTSCEFKGSHQAYQMCQRGKHNHDMKNLMARSEDIECSWIQSFRNLKCFSEVLSTTSGPQTLATYVTAPIRLRSAIITIQSKAIRCVCRVLPCSNRPCVANTVLLRPRLVYITIRRLRKVHDQNRGLQVIAEQQIAKTETYIL